MPGLPLSTGGSFGLSLLLPGACIGSDESDTEASDPPDHALVLCVDEKSQVQALERTQPLLPMGLGYVEGVTHDCYRHGSTTLFAALDMANGRVFAQCRARHRHQEFLSFLRHLDTEVPRPLELHLIIDNYTTHRHAKVRAWLAGHPRFHVHYIPIYSSWLT
jgi:putative transposase